MTHVDPRDQHRPTDPAKLAAECRRLYRGGLSARDIASCTHMPISEVLTALRPIFNQPEESQ